MVVAPRYVMFGVLCAGWLAAMLRFADSGAVRAAGLAWFTTWGIQMAVAITSWLRPFALPARYYLPRGSSAASGSTPSRRCARTPRRASRLLGLTLFGRIASWINPFRYDPRRPRELEVAMGAAETTHIVTFAVVTVLIVACLGNGGLGLAFFLALWNVLFNLYPIALQRHNRARLRQVTMRRARMASARAS